MEKKKRKLYKMQIDETSNGGVFAISLVNEPAIEELWIYMSKDFQIVQLKEVNTDKHILIGPVLIPDKEILRIDDKTGEEYNIMFTKDVVEKAAQLFLSTLKSNNTTLEHAIPLKDLSVVESWIVVDPLKDKSQTYNMTMPVGTWMVSLKVNNDAVWEDYIKTGKVRGFSLEGIFVHDLIEASKVSALSVDSRAENADELPVELSESEVDELLSEVKKIIDDHPEDEEETLRLLRERIG